MRDGMSPRLGLLSRGFLVGLELEQIASVDRGPMPREERRWPPVVALRVPLRRERLRVDPAQAIAIATLAVVAVGSIAGVWWFWVHGVTWFDVALFAFTTWGVG